MQQTGSDLTSAQVRARVAELLERVVDGQRTTDQISAGSVLPPVGVEMLFGCLRHYLSLDAAVSSVLDRPIEQKHRVAHCLMIVGAYQLGYMRIPKHAVINETVSAARVLKLPWLSSLVNAVLRQLTKTDFSVNDHSIEYPEWLSTRLARQYPNDWSSVASLLLERAPMALRVNVTATTPEKYADRLTSAGIAFEPSDEPTTIILAQPMATRDLPGFAAGEVSVQDIGSQQVARTISDLSAPASTPRILDACAAPGGKCHAMAERLPRATITALNVSQARLATLTAAGARLGHDRVRTQVADATTLTWWDDEPFDYVLADVPCSGTGTLRRHPDIKLIRRATDLPGLATLQGKLLANLWHTLKPGGTLLYSTCSLLEEENDAVIRGFLQRADDAQPVPIKFQPGIEREFGRQLLPTRNGGDGYYLCLLGKRKPR